MSDEERARRANALPPDWWKREAVCLNLSQWFGQHVLPLFLAVRIDGTPQEALYTGFLLEHEAGLRWITAGHVVDEINQVYATEGVQVVSFRWLDRGELAGAESVPAIYERARLLSGHTKGIDLGAIELSYMEEQPLRHNARVKIMTPEVYAHLDRAKPEGYYIVGYPQEWMTVSRKGNRGANALMSARADIACLPVERLSEPPPELVGIIPPDDYTFIGRLIPFAESSQSQPVGIKGMSGGPLFSIQREPDGHFKYYLFGIQRGWYEKSRVICAVALEGLVTGAGRVGE
jgi:hypothetical protein